MKKPNGHKHGGRADGSGDAARGGEGSAGGPGAVSGTTAHAFKTASVLVGNFVVVFLTLPPRRVRSRGGGGVTCHAPGGRHLNRPCRRVSDGGDEYDASPSLLLESHSIPPTFVRQILTKSTFCNKKL